MDAPAAQPARTAVRVPRGVWMTLACLLPLLLLGGAWWLMDEVLLVPGVPGRESTPDETIEFFVHEKGLPRLESPDAYAFLQQQVARLADDPAFREKFTVNLRRRSGEEQEAFRAHVFDVVWPRVRENAQHCLSLGPEDREAFLDERIVEYARMETMLKSLRPERGAGGSLFRGEDMIKWLQGKLSPEEQQAVLKYVRLLAERRAEILADEELKAELDAKIGALHP